MVTFLLEMNTLLGQNVLLNFVTGRYHRPRVEQRVFLIIDMKNSTAAAERLGEVAFHRLLDRLIGDLSGPIVAHKGEIHKYVGDELIATWPLAEGLREAPACWPASTPSRGWPRMARPMSASSASGGGPRRAPLRAGRGGRDGLVQEGDCALGDTLNTTARLVDACRETGESVIASADLLEQLVVPPGIAARPLGPIRLHGKEQAVGLCALAQATPDTRPVAS